MNQYLLKTIEFPPFILSQVISKVSPDRFDERIAPDRFTLREAIAHLADWEPIFRERIELGVQTPGATIVVYDEALFAEERNYADQDVYENLLRYSAERKKTASLVGTLSEEDFEKSLVHPELGLINLDDLANLILGHDMYHIEHACNFIEP